MEKKFKKIINKNNFLKIIYNNKIIKMNIFTEQEMEYTKIKQYFFEDTVYVFATNLTSAIYYIGKCKVKDIINNEIINNFRKNNFRIYFKSLIELNEEETRYIDLVYKE